MQFSPNPSSTRTGPPSQPVLVVNEPGLYSLILGSRKPEAKKFKRWITHVVLPEIRETGGYRAPGVLTYSPVDEPKMGATNLTRSDFLAILPLVHPSIQQDLVARAMMKLPEQPPGGWPFQEARHPRHAYTGPPPGVTSLYAGTPGQDSDDHYQ